MLLILIHVIDNCFVRFVNKPIIISGTNPWKLRTILNQQSSLILGISFKDCPRN